MNYNKVGINESPLIVSKVYTLFRNKQQGPHIYPHKAHTELKALSKFEKWEGLNTEDLFTLQQKKIY